MVSTWAFVIVLALFGFTLLMLELLVIPGFGVTGVVGIIGILGAVWYANVKLGTLEAVGVFAVTLLASVVLFTRVTKNGALGRLKNPAKSPGRIGEESNAGDKRPPLGARGVAVTPLRPAGIIQIEGKRYDVVAEGPIVDPGQAVEIVGHEGNIIRVKAL